MALPTSGPITLTDIQTEFGGTAPTSLNEYYAGGAYVPAGTSGTYGAVPSSGEISLRNFYGTSNAFIPTPFPPGNTANVDLRSYALSQGWNGNSQVQFTVDSGTTLYSTSTSTPALTISGSFPNGVVLVVNGSITGRGGNTPGQSGLGAGASVFTGPSFSCSIYHNGAPPPGGDGGTGLYVNGVLVTITNAGTIAGGGGGGGSNFFAPDPAFTRYSGGGGGGGAGGGLGAWSGCSNIWVGQYGQDATLTTPGAGGFGGPGGTGGEGGSGGALGQPGQSGFGRTGYSVFYPPAAGGAAGYSVVGDATITWIATGTRLGPIS